MQLLWSILLGIGSPVAMISAGLAMYNLYLKLTEEPLRGWHFNVSRPRVVTNGRKDADVIVRVMGPATLYEVRVRVWGAAKVRFDTDHEISKMTCEHDPLKLSLDATVGNPSDRLWVGLTWMEPTKRRAVEQCVRVNVWTDEYQRWQWHRFRNLFRFQQAPKGHWHTVGDSRPRARFYVEQWTGEGLEIEPKSVAPHRVRD